MALDPKLAANMAPGFEPVPLARMLLRTLRAGTLATLAPDGAPFASLTSVATDMDDTPLILISRLAAHTGHLARDARCSLLLSQSGKGDPLAHPRLTLVARGISVDRQSENGARVRARFLSRHPKAALYADFPDFSFWRLEIERVSLNGGFARAWEGLAGDILMPVDLSGELAAIEASAVEHMNEDHREAIGLYATGLAGQTAGAWRVSGVDPEGIDLMAGDRTARVLFPAPVSDGRGLRKMLASMAEEARAVRPAPHNQ